MNFLKRLGGNQPQKSQHGAEFVSKEQQYYQLEAMLKNLLTDVRRYTSLLGELFACKQSIYGYLLFFYNQKSSKRSIIDHMFKHHTRPMEQYIHAVKQEYEDSLCAELQSILAIFPETLKESNGLTFKKHQMATKKQYYQSLKRGNKKHNYAELAEVDKQVRILEHDYEYSVRKIIREFEGKINFKDAILDRFCVRMFESDTAFYQKLFKTSRVLRAQSLMFQYHRQYPAGLPSFYRDHRYEEQIQDSSDDDIEAPSSSALYEDTRFPHISVQNRDRAAQFMVNQLVEEHGFSYDAVHNVRQQHPHASMQKMRQLLTVPAPAAAAAAAPAPMIHMTPLSATPRTRSAGDAYNDSNADEEDDDDDEDEYDDDDVLRLPKATRILKSKSVSSATAAHFNRMNKAAPPRAPAPRQKPQKPSVYKSVDDADQAVQATMDRRRLSLNSYRSGTMSDHDMSEMAQEVQRTTTSNKSKKNKKHKKNSDNQQQQMSALANKQELAQQYVRKRSKQKQKHKNNTQSSQTQTPKATTTTTTKSAKTKTKTKHKTSDDALSSNSKKKRQDRNKNKKLNSNSKSQQPQPQTKTRHKNKNSKNKTNGNSNTSKSAKKLPSSSSSSAAAATAGGRNRNRNRTRHRERELRLTHVRSASTEMTQRQNTQRGAPPPPPRPSMPIALTKEDSKRFLKSIAFESVDITMKDGELEQEHEHEEDAARMHYRRSYTVDLTKMATQQRRSFIHLSQSNPKNLRTNSDQSSSTELLSSATDLIEDEYLARQSPGTLPPTPGVPHTLDIDMKSDDFPTGLLQDDLMTPPRSSFHQRVPKPKRVAQRKSTGSILVSPTLSHSLERKQMRSYQLGVHQQQKPRSRRTKYAQVQGLMEKDDRVIPWLWNKHKESEEAIYRYHRDPHPLGLSIHSMSGNFSYIHSLLHPQQPRHIGDPNNNIQPNRIGMNHVYMRSVNIRELRLDTSTVQQVVRQALINQKNATALIMKSPPARPSSGAMNHMIPQPRKMRSKTSETPGYIPYVKRTPLDQSRFNYPSASTTLHSASKSHHELHHKEAAQTQKKPKKQHRPSQPVPMPSKKKPQK